MPWAVLYEVPYLDILRHRIWVLWDLESALRFLILLGIYRSAWRHFGRCNRGYDTTYAGGLCVFPFLVFEFGEIPAFLCYIGNAFYSWLVCVSSAFCSGN